MKLLRNKFTETVLLLPIIAFFSVSAYYLYTSYSSYTYAQKSLNYSEYNKNLDTILSELGEEQGLIAIYLGTNGSTDYKQLESQWRRTNQKVAILQTFIASHPGYAAATQPILSALSNMRESHSKISVLNTSFDELYFNDTLINPVKLILDTMYDFNHESVNEHTTTMLNSYAAISRVKQNSMLERNYLSFILSRTEPMTKSELLNWDTLIAHDVMPSYKTLTPHTLVLQLNELLETENYLKNSREIDAERIAMLTYSNTGDFSTDVTEWYNAHSLKTTLLNEAQNILYGVVEETIQADIALQQKTMGISATILLLSLLLALVVRNIFSGMARETEQLEKVLQNIELDSDEEDEFQLKAMVARQDKTEIYKFLEKTIHESKESKRIADEASETKSKFLANMSHEIRTPLNGIVGFTGLLKSTNMDEEQEEFVEIIEKSSENLLSVINDILDLSKIESDKIEIEDTSFDPIVEFESAIESYGAKASEKNIHLSLFIDPNLSHNLKGDPTKIKQVLVNLISNAVKFTDDNGAINIMIEKVATSQNLSTVKFSVQDSGIGVTPEQKVKIFEAFSQADTSTTRKFGGTGLGLTISRKLVELMGGKLDLESEYGVGTTFFFTLELETLNRSFETETALKDLSIGYYHPESMFNKSADGYIREYISALGSEYKLFDSLTEIVSLASHELPNLIFADFDYLDENELLELNKLKSKISLITKVHNKDQVGALEHDFLKVIYEPVNFTKIRKSVESAGNIEKTHIPKESKDDKFYDLNVLVAEDNIINQKLIKRSLQNLGITVTIANNGEEAYKMRIANPYDLIFMDIQMPVMNGVEATHAILDYEKEHALEHVPIIALTANALKGDKERFLGEGMDNYAAKPIELNVITNILKEYFSDKLTSENTEMAENIEAQVEEEVTLQHTDIILCKQTEVETRVFNSILKKIGYSVDTASNVEEVIQMIDKKNYTYALLGKELKGLNNSGISSKLKERDISSVLFVQNMHSITSEDRQNYTKVVLDIASLDLLRHLMSRLIPLDCEHYHLDCI